MNLIDLDRGERLLGDTTLTADIIAGFAEVCDTLDSMAGRHGAPAGDRDAGQLWLMHRQLLAKSAATLRRFARLMPERVAARPCEFAALRQRLEQHWALSSHMLPLIGPGDLLIAMPMGRC
jgi:hypothetical protein